MDLMRYWKRHGTPAAKSLANAAYISWGHFRLIANKRRPAGEELADRLETLTNGEVKAIKLRRFKIRETGAPAMKTGNQRGRMWK